MYSKPEFSQSLPTREINKAEPWKLEGDTLQNSLQIYLEEIRNISHNLEPFLPETASKIKANIGSNKPKADILFKRIK